MKPLDTNNRNFLQYKNIFDYKQAEQNGEIPMMILTPIITNDAKTLMISPQNISYLSHQLLKTTYFKLLTNKFVLGIISLTEG